jgi:2-aminoadipate transaminase
MHTLYVNEREITMDYTFSQVTQGLKSSAVREILKLTQGKSIISFAGGLPAEEFFPIDAVQAAFTEVFRQGKGSLQYGITEGYTPLREMICKRMQHKGIQVDVDQMQITTGSQQAIDLLTKVYINPGDVILVENPTYLAALQVFQSYGAKVISVQGDEHGMDLTDLQVKITEHNPKLIYVIPTFANPTGRVWSLERRQGLLEHCKQQHIVILEDDPYGEIKFDKSAHYPSIYSLNGNADENPVIYTSTFSKTVAPALRTGWVVGDQRFIQQITKAKQAADLHSSTLDQQALYQLLAHYDLDQHIQTIRDEYQRRMEAMTAELRAANLPITWDHPQGGMFLWATLPEKMDAELLLKKAIEKEVAFVPGFVFFAETPKRNTLRLNFTYTDSEHMKLGVARLKAAFQEF